jgi:hypothetical protein
MGEMVSQTAELFVYLRAIRMGTRMGLGRPFLLPGSARSSKLGGSRNRRSECGDGLQEMCLRAIKKWFGFTKESTDPIGLTLVNDIVDR